MASGPDPLRPREPSLASPSTLPTIRSPSPGRVLSQPADAMSMDPFPVGFRAFHEEIVASWKPTIRAFVSVPGVIAGLLSMMFLGALGVNVVPGSATAAVSVAFVAAFVATILLWSWLLGRVLLLILPASFFLALLAAFIAAPAGVNPSVVGSSTPVFQAEVVLFLLLSLVGPLALGVLAWFQSFYALSGQRAIEITGWAKRRSRSVALDAVERVVPTQSWFGRRYGYGTVLIFDRVPPGGHGLRHHPETIRRNGVGVAFVGVRRSTETALGIERRVKELRAAGATSAANIGPAPSPAPAGASPSVPPAGPSPIASPSGARSCLRCGTPLVWIAPEGRYYCPRCAEYS